MMRRVLYIAALLLLAMPASAATKVWLKQQLSSVSGLAAYDYASLTESVLPLTTCVTNKINGTTQQTHAAAGAVCEWISPPIATALTISSAETCNTWVKTSSTTGAPKTICRLYKYSGGTSTQIGTATSAHTQTTAITNDSFTVTPTSTAFAAGDRIGIAFWVSSTSATGTETIDYAGLTSAADGDSFVSFAEAISFMSDAEYIQGLAGSGSTTTITGTWPGRPKTGNLIICSGIILASPSAPDTAAISDGATNTYVPLSTTPTLWDTSSESAQYNWYAGNATTTTTVSMTKSASDSQFLTLSCGEYGGVAAVPFDVTSSAVGTGNSSTATSNATPPVNYTNELIVGFEDDEDDTWTPTTPYLNRDGSLNDESVKGSSGTYAASGTYSMSAQWVLTTATFLWATSNPLCAQRKTLLGAGC